MQRSTILSAATILASAATMAHGAILLSTSYSQNFDSLPNSPNVAAQSATNTWTNDSTIAGWHSAGTGTYSNGIAVSDGTGNLLTSNGSSMASLGTLSDSDRALSPAKRNSTSYIGAQFANQTGGAITQLQISYTGEQWRLNSTGPYAPITFAYSTDATSLTTGTWNPVSALDFDMPQDAEGTNTALNGNAAANRASLSHTITSLSIANGSNFWIRWTNGTNNNGNYVGVDDFAIVVPEPASLGLLGLGGLALVRRRR